MKKLTGIAVIILAALICSFGVCSAYAPADRPYIDFVAQSSHCAIDETASGYTYYMYITSVPSTLYFKGTIVIPSGSYGRVKIEVKYTGTTNTSDIYNVYNPTNGQQIYFTVNTAKMALNKACDQYGKANLSDIAVTFFYTTSGSFATPPAGLNVVKCCPGTNGCCQNVTAIELSSFTTTVEDGEVILNWETESETNNVGFNIYRSTKKNTGYEKINEDLIPAVGSETVGAAYEFVDTNIAKRKVFYYMLEDIDVEGNSIMHGPVKSIPKNLRAILGK